MQSSEISFASDNHAGVDPKILEAIVEANAGSAAAYGTDQISSDARDLFKQAFGSSASAHWVFNGTAANVTALKTLLEPWESVICASSSHLHLDECAAPEAVGSFKLIPVDTPDGKLRPEHIEAHVIRRGDQHFAQPRVVSITQPTEWGTLYSLTELEVIRDTCRNHGLLVHIDGARLSVAAAALNVNFRQITEASGASAISFGGTKNGLLGCEAVILFSKEHSQRFRYLRKQCMQLPSKTRFIGAQFRAYLRDDYWRTLALPSIHLAAKLSKEVSRLNHVKLRQVTEANSVFAVIPQRWNKPLKQTAFFYVWEEDTNTVRWMFSSQNSEAELSTFTRALRELDSRHLESER